jgi:hypothetical protein
MRVKANLHFMVDNLFAHLTEDPDSCSSPTLECLDFTPTHASWLNEVLELFFSILERRPLRRGEFGSIDQLTRRIVSFMDGDNRRARSIQSGLRRVGHSWPRKSQ